jgi:hypothetical protein
MASDTAQRLQAEHEVGATWVAEEERLAVLQRSQLLDLPSEPEFDRWTVALRRETGAALAALVLVDATRMVVKSLSIAGGSVQEASELPLSTPLAEYLIGRTDLPACPAAPAYAEAQVVVNGQLLGWMVVADHPVREWSESHLKALEDAATGVSTEVSVRLAHQAATRMQELVASHNRLHELIAQAAP